MLTLEINETTTSGIRYSNHSSISLILNILLIISVFSFVLGSIHFIHHQNRLISYEINDQTFLTSTDSSVEARRTKTYFDYEPYVHDGKLKILSNRKLRRFVFIDLGCFDGRDIDYFLHFHLNEVLRRGHLTVIAFEPDPINFSACKTSEQRHPNIQHTMVESAVWTETGRIPYALEKGQRSRIDNASLLLVQAVDFSAWLRSTVEKDDYVYIKFTVEGAEIPILEKLVYDETLSLIDYMEIEWHDAISADFEPRRISLECMFDNFGMDFLFFINPADLRHGYHVRDLFESIPKSKDW